MQVQNNQTNNTVQFGNAHKLVIDNKQMLAGLITKTKKFEGDYFFRHENAGGTLYTGSDARLINSLVSNRTQLEERLSSAYVGIRNLAENHLRIINNALKQVFDETEVQGTINVKSEKQIQKLITEEHAD